VIPFIERGFPLRFEYAGVEVPGDGMDVEVLLQSKNAFCKLPKEANLRIEQLVGCFSSVESKINCSFVSVVSDVKSFTGIF